MINMDQEMAMLEERAKECDTKEQPERAKRLREAIQLMKDFRKKCEEIKNAQTNN